MYRVKPNGNYNVVLDDIKITVSATSVDGIELADDKVETSSDITRMVNAGYLIVEKLDAKQSSDESAKVATGPVPTAFVSGTNEDEINSGDVFIAHKEQLTINDGVAEVQTDIIGPSDEVTMTMEPVVKEAPAETAPTEAVTDEVTSDKTVADKAVKATKAANAAKAAKKTSKTKPAAKDSSKKSTKK